MPHAPRHNTPPQHDPNIDPNINPLLLQHFRKASTRPSRYQLNHTSFPNPNNFPHFPTNKPTHKYINIDRRTSDTGTLSSSLPRHSPQLASIRIPKHSHMSNKSTSNISPTKKTQANSTSSTAHWISATGSHSSMLPRQASQLTSSLLRTVDTSSTSTRHQSPPTPTPTHQLPTQQSQTHEPHPPTLLSTSTSQHANNLITELGSCPTRDHSNPNLSSTTSSSTNNFPISSDTTFSGPKSLNLRALFDENTTNAPTTSGCSRPLDPLWMSTGG